MNIINYIIKWYKSRFKGIVYAEDSLPEEPLQLPEELRHTDAELEEFIRLSKRKRD